ncbi:hypothetical protein ACFLYW_02255 [Thermodesulfobacteriota bacterium]
MDVSADVLGFVIIIYIYLIAVVVKSKKYGLYVIFTIAFMMGILNIVGIPNLFTRFAFESLVVILFTKSLFVAQKRSHVNYNSFGAYYVVALLVVSVGSFFANNVHFVGFLYYLRMVFVYFLLFYAFLNTQYTSSEIRKINKFIFFLFLIQLPASLIKYNIVGQIEDIAIGTMEISAGSLNALIPMFVSSYLLSAYFYKRKMINIFLMLAFVLFGIIGNKRALIVYLPLIFMILYFLYTIGYRKEKRQLSKRNIVVNFTICAIIGFGAIYASARLIPTLNPEGEIGGSFNLEYVMEFSESYTTRYSTKNPHELGRLKAPEITYKVLKEGGFGIILLGLGAGDIVHSRFDPDSKNARLKKYGLGYGSGTGLLWMFIQIGIIGSLIFLLFYLKLVLRIYKIWLHSNNLETNIRSLSFLGMTAVFFIDFTTYSTGFMTSNVLMGVYFYLAAIILKEPSNKKLITSTSSQPKPIPSWDHNVPNRYQPRNTEIPLQ